jgi:hypothetical protein
VERLSLSRCSIPEQGGKEVAASLRAGNARLRALVLSHNGLGERSIT